MASKLRDRILSSAVSCFAATGYSGCPTAAIAKKADVSEDSLFRLYQSKEKLFEAALGHVLALKVLHPRHLRVVAFALLEGRGLSEANAAAIRRLAAVTPVIKNITFLSR